MARVLTSLFEGNEHVREGSMFGHPAFYASGKLFVCAYGQGVGLKLPADRVQSMEGQRHISPFQPEMVESRHPDIGIDILTAAPCLRYGRPVSAEAACPLLIPLPVARLALS